MGGIQPADGETCNWMTIEELIEASSLGSPGAKAIRARNPLWLRDQALARIRGLVPGDSKPPDARKPQNLAPGDPAVGRDSSRDRPCLVVRSLPVIRSRYPVWCTGCDHTTASRDLSPPGQGS
jgi:hypothetical protein